MSKGVSKRSRVVRKPVTGPHATPPVRGAGPSLPVADSGRRQALEITTDSFVLLDGVKIARLVANGDGRPCLEFIDSDTRRADRKGRKVMVAIQELIDTLGCT